MSVEALPQGDYVTIIAPSVGEAMEQFRAQGLAAAGYAIVAPVGPHRFTLVTESGVADPFADRPLIAATFRRAAAR